MTDIFFYALAVSVVYFLFKLLEMKFVAEEDKQPLKVIIKDTLFVYVTSMIGIYMYSQFDTKQKGGNQPSAFLNSPEF
jgi:hypothetical protein